MLDLIIKNGTIVDGTGDKRFKADIGIKEEKICIINSNIHEESKRTIDVEGYVVAPGFIDMHGHSDFTLLTNNKGESKIRQGVTTEVVGNCGFTAAPVTEKHFDNLIQYLANTVVLDDETKKGWKWKSQKDYIKEFSKEGISFNVAPLVGHGTIRVGVMGFDNRRPDANEMNEMKSLLRNELKEGLFGMSTGLEYEPGSYADTAELVEMCKVIEEFNGIYTTHMKNEGRDVLDCIDQAIEIGRESGVSVQISHLKAQNKPNWGKVEDALEIIDKANVDGINVGFDVYPYIAFGSGLIDLIPPWIKGEGTKKMIEILKDDSNRLKVIEDMKKGFEEWENPMLAKDWDKNIKIAMLKTEKNRKYEGFTLDKIAEDMKCSPYEAAINLLIEEDGSVKCIFFAMCEEDLRTVMKHPKAMFCTDGRAVATYGELGRGSVHPRYYGTYPKILGHYVRDEKILGLEEAIKKMTMLPAEKLQLKKRGLIKEGYFSDIVIFNDDEIIDLATFDDPHQYSKGIEYVIVNGAIVVEKGHHTNLLPGKILDRRVD